MDRDALERACAATEAAIARNPRESKFGVLEVDDSAGAYSTCVTLWFADESTLADYIEHAFSLLSGAHDDEYVSGALTAVAAEVRVRGMQPQILAELQEINSLPIRIAWLGSLEDLCSGSVEATRQLIARFREGRNHAAIGAGEVDQFVDFLRSLPENL